MKKLIFSPLTSVSVSNIKLKNTLKHSIFALLSIVLNYNSFALTNAASAVSVTMAIDIHDNIVVAGDMETDNTGSNYAIVKYDKHGKKIWVQKYNGPGNGDDYVNAIAVDSSANVYVTGESYGGLSSSDYATIKYDKDGNEIWIKRYNGPGNGDDGGKSIAVDSLGDTFVTGYAYGGSDLYLDIATVKYSPQGNEEWVRIFCGEKGKGTGFEEGQTVSIDNENNIYVTGYTSGYSTKCDIVTIKYDTQGNSIWRKQYNGLGSQDDSPKASKIDSSNSIVIVGESYGGSNVKLNAVIIRYLSSGNLNMNRTYNTYYNGDDSANAIEVDDKHNIYIAGYCYSGVKKGTDFFTAKYSNQGKLLWQAKYNGPKYGYDEAFSIALNSGGSIYVSGVSYNSQGEGNFATIKYDARGKEVWVRRYSGAGSGYYGGARAARVDSEGNLIITGTSHTSAKEIILRP